MRGEAATVDVGTIVAIAPDATPQVTNSGTIYDAILNFAIPQGYDGFSPIATVTQNTGSATISITDANGTTTATVNDGATGPQGPAGASGATGATPSITMTASVDNTTGIPSVTVTQSGTDENPTFDLAFEHLKGETGTLPAPTNYISSITPTLGTFTANNGQQVMLYGDGTVLINISLMTNQVLNAKTPYALLTIPTAIRPIDTRNRLLTAYAYCRTTGGAYVRPADNQLRIWFMDEIPSGSEINICGVYNIN
jgi:hypothetical protein